MASEMCSSSAFSWGMTVGVKREKGRKSVGRGHNMKILHEAGSPLASKSLPFTEILEHTGAWQYWGLEYCSM